MKRTQSTLIAACAGARDLEAEGRFSEAREALSAFWLGLGHDPLLDGLVDAERAELLLRVGKLTGVLGAAERMAGAQELAKDLLGRAARLFESLGDDDGAAEAQTATALAYWREGAMPEAAAILDTVLDARGRLARRVALEAMLVRATLLRWEGRYYDACDMLGEARTLLAEHDPARLHGSYYSALGTAYFFMAVATGQRSLLERAENEYIAASVYYSDAGHEAYRASVENNLAYIYMLLGNLAAAHSHLDVAAEALRKTGSAREAAQSNETRARVFIAAGDLAAAEASASAAVESLSRGDASALLAEALTTRGVARARLGLLSEARADLNLAGEVASRVGDGAGAGRARLALFEELRAFLTLEEAQEAYDEAARLLDGVQDASIAKRLREAARGLYAMTREQLSALESAAYTWSGFSFEAAVHNFKKLWIERALRDAGGIVSKAARLLKMANHQSLFKMLIEGEFKSLRHLQKQKKQKSRLTVKGRSKQSRRSARAVRAPQARACCSPAAVAFKRLKLKTGDDTLAARGPRGGDSLIVDVRAQAADGDLVVVVHLDLSYYGYLRTEGGTIFLDYPGTHREPEDFSKKTPGDVHVAGPVVAYASKDDPRRIRQLLPL
jgi:hypothetical protein